MKRRKMKGKEVSPQPPQEPQQPPQPPAEQQPPQPAQPAQPPTPQPVQAPRGFPWWATVTIVAALLLTLFGLVWVITSKIPNKRIAKTIPTSERAEITMIGNFSGVDSDKDLSNKPLAKIDSSAKKEQEHQIAVEKPAPAPSAAPSTEGTLVLAIENRSPYSIRVTTDKIPGCWVIRPGDEVLLPPLARPMDVRVYAVYLDRCGRKKGEHTEGVTANRFNNSDIRVTKGGHYADVIVWFSWN